MQVDLANFEVDLINIELKISNRRFNGAGISGDSGQKIRRVGRGRGLMSTGVVGGRV